MHRTLTALLTTAGTTLALLTGAGAAQAAPVPARATVQQQIDGILAEHPDAVQTGASTVTLHNGAATLRLAGAAGIASCGADRICVWEDIDFGGAMLSWTASAVTLCNVDNWVNLPDYGFNDKTSSWANMSLYYNAYLWQNVDKGNLLAALPPGENSPNLGGANDKASSLSCFAA